MLEKIGKYKVVERIGRGAMGEVYKAHDPILKRNVAVKTISTDVAPDSSLRKRFEREAQSAAQLSHPNIITVYDFGQEGELLYMAMELLEGQDLKQAIKRRAIRTIEQKLKVMEQLCDGLELAHSQNIVHRDLKPANVHIQPDGQVKIMDFGLARLSGSEMTRTGMVMGTPNYMAPEQVRGEKADTRSDVFSIGCCFYELLCARKPFDADSMHAVLFKVMQEAPVSLREKVRDLPVVLVQIVEKCLAKDPNLRFQDARELRQAVREARQAIDAGTGFRPLPGLELPSPDALGAPPGDATSAPGSSMGSVSSSTGWSGSGSGSGSMAGASPKRPLIIGVGVLALLALAVVIVRVTGPPGTPGADQPERDRVMDALVQSQLQLAQRHLEAGNYRQAVERAESALAYAPDNAEARAIHEEAKGIVDRVDAALAKAQAATVSEEAAEAGWELMQADPGHAMAAQLATEHQAAFRDHVDEARAAMNEAREAAAAVGAASLQEFHQADALVAEADEDAGAGRAGSAALKLLKAREAFERAARAAR